LGIAIGLWMYSPARRYQYAGAATSIPYRGQKRWHMILGLIAGLGAVTWAFSGMLSMDPFPTGTGRARGGEVAGILRGRLQVAAFAAKHPRDAILELGGFGVKELELTSFSGEAVYLATGARGETRIVPVHGTPMREFRSERVIETVRGALKPVEVRVMGN